MIRATVEVGWKSMSGGRHRTEGRENEDAVLVATDHPALDAVLLVADGMGGHPEPQLAAQTAAACAREYLSRGATHRASLPDLLRGAVAFAERGVRELASRATNGKAPGTTLTVAVIAEGALHIAHLGDGSVFLYRDGTARRLAGGEERRVGRAGGGRFCRRGPAGRRLSDGPRVAARGAPTRRGQCAASAGGAGVRHQCSRAARRDYHPGGRRESSRLRAPGRRASRPAGTG